MTIAAADLHVHSRYSDRPSERALARVGAPESYTDPRLIYRRCRERGMALVTITDHDTIDGALEIAHLPGAFVSCEVTVVTPRHVRLRLLQGKAVRRVGDIELLDSNTTRTIHHVTPADGAPFTETTIWHRDVS